MNENEINNSEKVGPLVGSVIIIVIIILGAFYLFSTIKQKVDAQKAQTEETQMKDVNQTDELAEIESDINTTDVDSFDEEMESLQVEFQI